MRVPWMVSSVPKEMLNFDEANSRLILDFIAYFKCHPIENELDESLYIVPEPEPFRPAHDYERKPYHIVRLIFESVEDYEKFWNVSDSEDIPEADYDWTHVPFNRLEPGQTIEDNLKAANMYWLNTGFSPNPFFHQVLQPNQKPEDQIDIKYYFWFGMDESLAISARSWTWELGQSVK